MSTPVPVKIKTKVRRGGRRRVSSWVSASQPFSWGQRFSWLISALSGTVETEKEIARLEELNSRMDSLFASQPTKSKPAPLQQND